MCVGVFTPPSDTETAVNLMLSLIEDQMKESGYIVDSVLILASACRHLRKQERREAGVGNGW